MTLLLDMTRAHVPVLAGELIDALDPAPGVARGRLHLRRGRPRAARRRPARRDAARSSASTATRRPRSTSPSSPSEVAVRDALHRAATTPTCCPSCAEEGLQADLLYMDLGISSMQVDARERGFSYSYDAPLDMRMDTAQDLDARTILNEWPEARLAATIREYGEERYARRIAREIVRRRERAPIDTTTELVDAIKRAVPTPAQFAGGHPARRTFQAIRIAVNDELGSLERALPAAWELLRPGGRMAVISFHSLEDRRVKRFFAELARGCICPPELPVCVCGHEPRGRARQPPRGAAERGRGRRQPARAVGPPARRGEARRRTRSLRFSKGVTRDAAAHDRCPHARPRGPPSAQARPDIRRRGSPVPPSPGAGPGPSGGGRGSAAASAACRSARSPIVRCAPVCTLRDSQLVDRLVRGRAGSRCSGCC